MDYKVVRLKETFLSIIKIVFSINRAEVGVKLSIFQFLSIDNYIIILQLFKKIKKYATNVGNLVL